MIVTLKEKKKKTYLYADAGAELNEEIKGGPSSFPVEKEKRKTIGQILRE